MGEVLRKRTAFFDNRQLSNRFQRLLLNEVFDPEFREKMEHRLSERRPITLDVLIFHQDLPVGRGRTRNMGREGMFIETKIRDFPEGTVLAIELDVATDEDERRIRLPALVIHRNGEGMGLMFLTLVPEIEDMLQTLDPLQA